MPDLSTQLIPIFAALDAPTIVTRADAHDQLLPILQFVGDAQRQVAEHRQTLTVVELQDDTTADAVRGKTESLHQTLDALDEDLKKLLYHGQRIAQGFRQLPRYSERLQKEFGIVALGGLQATDPLPPTV